MTFYPNEENYIGDGLYASFDGYQFKLRAPRLDGDHEVFLEPVVMLTFISFAKQVQEHYDRKGLTK